MGKASGKSSANLKKKSKLRVAQESYLYEGKAVIQVFFFYEAWRWDRIAVGKKKFKKKRVIYHHFHFAGQRLKEGGHINRSLLTLGSVIAKLSEGER